MSLNIGGRMAKFSTEHPRMVTGVMTAVTLAMLTLALLPSIWPQQFGMLHPLVVDTDPENMLPEDEDVRVFHNAMKKEMSLYDMVVVGIVNEEHPQGVFNPESLQRIHELTEFAKGLRWPDPDNPGEEEGVIEIDIIAPSTVDNISQGEQPGFVDFSWLMKQPPQSEEEALSIRRKAQRIPFLNGTMVSEDGKAIALYLPLTSKDLSGRVYEELKEKIAAFDGDEQYHITGLPVAEDVFGIEMFKQMAVSAPLAMLVVFLLMLYFFRKFTLIVSPMVLAVVSIAMTMSLLVATGNVVHIMSSMIPIFIMPIAVLDAVHIISEFFDRYQKVKDRRKTIIHVMENLFVPMLYTSMTTAVGFGSLALVPIPPVQVFGLFVAFGVLVAWILTMTFIPAYVMFIKDESLENFGMAEENLEGEKKPLMSRILQAVGHGTVRNAKLVVVFLIVLGIISVYGIKQIQINDNPVKWFTSSHPIRVADRVLNEHFGGTYMAYLTLESQSRQQTAAEFASGLEKRLESAKDEFESIPNMAAVLDQLKAKAKSLATESGSVAELLKSLETYADDRIFNGPEEEYEAWDRAFSLLSSEDSSAEMFKQPAALALIERLQSHLARTGIVGKSNSLADIVKTVNRELVSGEEKDFRIPGSAAGVAQNLLQYQNSHRPQDLWHFVTPDYKKSVIWIQLRSGDNQDMNKVVAAVDEFMSEPGNLEGLEVDHKWFGLTYINVIWQDKMVAGMLQALLGSFLMVFLMMTILYRSALWGALSMIPLTITIAVVYAVIGFVGKDYDMPVAVLSSMSLGLAVDYAIHFISRSRSKYLLHETWKDCVTPMFEAPARAITRNVVVAGVGFLPLLAAPLIPYKTVGFFIAAILLSAGLATLLVLPALISILERALFPKKRGLCLVCHCVTCIVSSVSIILVIAINLYHFLSTGWDTMSWFGLAAVLLMAIGCYLVGKLKQSRIRFPIDKWGNPLEEQAEQEDPNEQS